MSLVPFFDLARRAERLLRGVGVGRDDVTDLSSASEGPITLEEAIATMERARARRAKLDLRVEQLAKQAILERHGPEIAEGVVYGSAAHATTYFFRRR